MCESVLTFEIGSLQRERERERERFVLIALAKGICTPLIEFIFNLINTNSLINPCVIDLFTCAKIRLD